MGRDPPLHAVGGVGRRASLIEEEGNWGE